MGLLFQKFKMCVHKCTILWIFFTLLVTVTQADVCPFMCSCQNDGVINCASRALDRVPRFTEAPHLLYESLDLSQNDLYSITHFVFKNINVKKINLSGNHLVGISPRAFHGVEENLEGLDLHNTNLYVIHWAVFNKLTKLKSLNLSTNRLFTLQKELLQKLASLIHLDLSLNRLTSLDNTALSGLNNLETLNLEGNALLKVDKDAFANLNNLKKLNLRSNRLSFLDQKVFNRLEELLELDMSDNLLKNIPTEIFKAMSKLQMLHWDQNNLTEIGPKAFNGAYKLSMLTLSFNSIVNISTDAFLGLSLASLDLSSNNIEFLGSRDECRIRNVQYIKELKLSSNPLQCNCFLSWVGDIIGKSANVVGTCAGPPKYKTQSITRVDFSNCDNEKFCLPKEKSSSDPNENDDS